MPRWNGKWKGGRTYLDRADRTIYWLDRCYRGKRYGVRLDVGSEREAEAELALFLRDPRGYVERKEAKLDTEQEAKVPMDTELVESFEEHLNKLGRDARHVRSVGHYLRWWAAQLKGRDLRRVTLKDLRRCLKTEQTAKRNRIAVYKVFCTFLREELAILPRGSDASLDLHAPPPRPEKAVRDKGYSIERVEQFYRGISAWESKRPGWALKTVDVQSVRDCVLLHSKTGLHQTEVERLAKGKGTVTELDGQGEIAGTIYFLHKSGYEHTISVDQQTLAAARRLQKRGGAPSDSYIRKVIARTAKNLGVDKVRLGELRHSFTTWARTSGELVRPMGRGVSVEEVAAVLGHTSTRTTRLHYDGTEVPPMVLVPITLFHPDDPSDGNASLGLIQSG